MSIAYGCRSNPPLPRPARFLANSACSLLVACLLPGLAKANDSVGHLAAGGLVLGQTDAIEMRSEDLFISTKEVRVRYRFFNRAKRDVQTIVAFPLPDIQAPSEVNNFVIPRPEQSADVFGFETRVDGRSVKMKVQQKAISVGIDRTTMLQELGLPVSPLSQDLPDKIAALSAAALEGLRRAGMIGSEVFDAGQGMVRQYRPLWTVRTTFYWTQTFRLDTLSLSNIATHRLSAGRHRHSSARTMRRRG